MVITEEGNDTARDLGSQVLNLPATSSSLCVTVWSSSKEIPGVI